jgi:putative cardiolipin synthase
MLLGPTLLFALLLPAIASCQDEPSSPAPSTSSATADPGADSDEGRLPLFTDAYQFECSPLKATGCTGVFEVRKRSEAAVLRTGEDAYRARIALLETAKKSIRVQALIFRADEAGLHVAELLKRKKKAGLDVRVIVDATSNLDFQTQWMYFDLKQHGIEVEGYEALYLHAASADVDPKDPLRANKRFHDKLWIVDGEDPDTGEAVVGGLNIANEYFRIATEPLLKWRDQDVVLRGPIVADTVAAFDRNYEYFKQIKQERPAVLNTDNSWKLTRQTVAKIVKVKVPHWVRKDHEQLRDALLDKPVELAFKPVRARFLQSRPRFEETFIEQAYLHLLGEAKTSIQIANAYFIPSKAMIDAMHAAARRGVKVVIVTNSPETNDISVVARISRYTYQRVLAVNQEPDFIAKKLPPVEVREWAALEHDEGTLHAKFMVIDRRIAIVGSFNLDPRSARLNSETAVALDSPDLVGTLAKGFDEIYVARSKAVTWDEATTYHRPEDVESTFKLLFALPLKDWL